MKKCFFCSLAWVFVLITTLLQTSMAYPANNHNKTVNEKIHVICLAQQPVIYLGESVDLQTLVTISDNHANAKQINFEWHATAGKIHGIGSNVQWDLTNVTIEPKRFNKEVVAVVNATSQDLGSTECKITVVIENTKTHSNFSIALGMEILHKMPNKILPDWLIDSLIEEYLQPTITMRQRSYRPQESDTYLISARSYLLPNETPKSSYGLYSYLLFSTPPLNHEEQSRYLQMIKSYLILINSVDEFLERQLHPSKLNVIFIPVKSLPRKNNLVDKLAENILAEYDYVAAQILLNKFNKAYQKGPYLISILKPLSNEESSVPTYLFQDLTGVVPDLVGEWIKYFCYLGAQQHDWKEKTLKAFALKLRNAIAVAAKIIPNYSSTLDKTIVLVDAK